MKEKTQFIIDKSKCIKCGNCINTCSGMVLEFDVAKDFHNYSQFTKTMMKDDLSKIVELLNISKKTVKIIKENLFLLSSIIFV